jgi:hypothetical protein
MAESVVVGYPSVQLVGLEMLHCEPGVYCGNDYAAAAGLPASTLDEVRQQTERIGGWIASLGYRGLFGLDFVLDPSSSQVYAVDLNARWQGSTALLTQAECRAGRLPLAAADLACQLGVLGEAEIRRRGDAFFEPVRGSQMSLRSDLADWSKVTGELEPGVHSSGPEPAYLRPGVSLEDLRGPGEMLVTGAVPRTGDLMLKGAPVLRVYSLEPVKDLDRMAPLPWSQRAVQELYRRLALEPVQQDPSPARRL